MNTIHVFLFPKFYPLLCENSKKRLNVRGEAAAVSQSTVEICQRCKIGFSLFMTCFNSEVVRFNKENKTCLELTPCDFVALLLDPNEERHLESGSNLDLIRCCFHQCLALSRNGVSDHIYDALLGYNPVLQKEIEYVV